jgi:predicted nucleotidyltransferase
MGEMRVPANDFDSAQMARGGLDLASCDRQSWAILIPCAEMIDLILHHKGTLNDLCYRYGVLRLELFGSAARGDFDACRSDLDFLVVFRRDLQMNPADRFLGLLGELEKVFSRKVDLVDVQAHRNPYFMAEALKHREVVYAA